MGVFGRQMIVLCVCVCVSGLNGILPDKLEASKADAFDWVY